MASSAPAHSDHRLSNRWVVLITLLFISIFNFADRFLLAGLVEPIKASFAVSDGFMGLLMGPAFAVLYTTLAIPIARTADRRSRVAIIAGGCLLWSVFTALSGMAQGPASLAAARVGVGIGEAAFGAPAYSLLAAYFTEAQRGKAFAVLGIATYVGQIAGYAAGPAIANAHDWRFAFIAMAVPGVVLSGMALLLIREPSRVLAAVQPPAWPLFARLLRSRAFVRLMLGMGLGVLSGVAFGNWGPTLFVRSFALSPKEAGSTFGLYFGLAGLAGMLLFGVLADRQARLAMHRPVTMAAVALLAASACVLAVTWSESLLLARLLAIPSGLLGGGWSIGVMASLQYLLPDRVRASATALFLMVSTFLGYVIGPWLVGVISHALGDGAMSLQLGLSVAIPLGFAGALLLFSAAEHLEADRKTLADL